MGLNTKIEYATDTWNPWIGCRPVSEGCQHCYARVWAARSGISFEPHLASPSTWALAKKFKPGARVLTCSLSDFFVRDSGAGWRAKAFDVMASRPDVHWLILTKRIEEISPLTSDWERALAGLSHVWMGVTVENQKQADARIPALDRVWPGRKWISAEPLLGPIELPGVKVEWVVCGAETGAGARRMEESWARGLWEQCCGREIPFFFKRDSGGSRLLDGVKREEYPKALV